MKQHACCGACTSTMHVHRSRYCFQLSVVVRGTALACAVAAIQLPHHLLPQGSSVAARTGGSQRPPWRGAAGIGGSACIYQRRRRLQARLAPAAISRGGRRNSLWLIINATEIASCTLHRISILHTVARLSSIHTVIALSSHSSEIVGYCIDFILCISLIEVLIIYCFIGITNL